MELLVIGGLVLFGIMAIFNRKPKEKTMRVRPVAPPPPTSVHVKYYTPGQYFFFALLFWGIYAALAYLATGVIAGMCDPSNSWEGVLLGLVIGNCVVLTVLGKVILPKAFWQNGAALNKTWGNQPILKLIIGGMFIYFLVTHVSAATSC